MLDVLLLLPVPRRLLEGFDDEGGCGWYDRDGSLTVLDGELHGDTETFLKRQNNQILSTESESDVLHTQSPVAFAISSPTFFGDNPKGPILGASADEAPTSPPVARRWLQTPVSIFCPAPPV